MRRESKTEVSKRAYSVPEAATIISFGRSKTWELIRSGELKARKHGGRTVVLASDLEAFLQNLETAR